MALGLEELNEGSTDPVTCQQQDEQSRSCTSAGVCGMCKSQCQCIVIFVSVYKLKLVCFKPVSQSVDSAQRKC